MYDSVGGPCKVHSLRDAATKVIPIFFAIMIKKLKLIRGSHRDAASGSVTHRLGGSRGDVAGENEMENSEKKEKEKRRSERGYEYVIRHHHHSYLGLPGVLWNVLQRRPRVP